MDEAFKVPLLMAPELLKLRNNVPGYIPGASPAVGLSLGVVTLNAPKLEEALDMGASVKPAFQLVVTLALVKLTPNLALSLSVPESLRILNPESLSYVPVKPSWLIGKTLLDKLNVKMPSLGDSFDAKG